VLIENDVIVGNRVTIKSGVQLWDGIRVFDDVFIGPNATFTNDRFPRSGHRDKRPLPTTIEAGASIGAGAVILPGLSIGRQAMVGAGAVVTRSVPSYAVVMGNPARIVGYVDARPIEGPKADAAVPSVGVKATRVKGVNLHQFPKFADIRGKLSVGEFGRDLPFASQRYFLVFDVPSIETRGQHAHRECHELLICVHGKCSVVAEDGINREEFLLDRPDLGLHLPPMVWATEYNYSSDAVLLVFASHHYDAEDYIRDYDEFIQLTRPLRDTVS
jgi:carbonic anhydrase/acetyltransferase-like protein (isoleucine patch superfamily)/dTDP-4-dehydrorhamnose 3,5-epimerase-like enzyme